MDKMIGIILSGRYEIVELIGTGGMSNVYKAKCNVLNRFVAVKLLKEEYKFQEDFFKRFKTESQAVALLSHPNIVSVYDVGTHDGLPYIVMELMEGITLKEYITQKGPLSWKEIVLFSSQILKALEHAHSRRIIHRDIKPQNIMLLRDGTIKVADFGIARFTVSNTQTITENAIGSAHYLSPEQAKGSVTDEKTDIYAVGVVMYEMLTGRVPFDAENPVMVAIMHLHGNPKAPSEYRKDILSGLESITMRAMSREAYKRYPSASSMLADIEHLRKNPSIEFEFKYTYNPSQNTQYFEKIDENYTPLKRPPYTGAASKRTATRPRSEKNLPMAVMISAIFIGLIILFVLVSNGVKMFNNLISTGDIYGGVEVEQVEVPNLIGLGYDAVLNNELYKENFVIVSTESSYSNTVKAGNIISQEPTPDKNVRPGTTIDVMVSLGKKQVQIPELKNIEYRKAMLELQSYKLTVNKVEEYHDEIIEGCVIRTDPGAGEMVNENDEVTIYVSLGKEIKQISMPDVIGMNIENARKTLIAGNFVIKEVKQVESAQEKGTVVAQSIPANSMVEEKTEVILEVSAGMITQKTILINLPVSPQEFVLSVTVNGVEQYREIHKASEGMAYITVSGSGSSLVEVFVNDKIHSSDIINFNG